jgi:phosphonate ABC transporter permease subunit PhnE
VNDQPTGTEDGKQNPFVRILVIWGAILAIIAGYAFAVRATDVDLTEIKDEQRRVQLFRIIRGLARPDIIEYELETTYHTVEVATPCPADGFEPTPPDASGPYIEMIPACAEADAEVVVRGFNFDPGTDAPLSFIPPSGVTLKLANVVVGQDGTFEVEVELPDRPDEVVQELRLTTRERVGGWQFTDTAKQTWEKIIETVMLALVATSVGTLAAIPLSFFSARNLMRSIRTPLISVALFVIGIAGGLMVGRQIGRWVTDTASRVADNVAVLLGLIVGIAVVGRLLLAWALSEEEEETAPPLSLVLLRRAVVAAVTLAAIFALGFLGHIFMWVGDKITQPLDDFLIPLGFVGNLFFVIGDLTTTFMTAVTALIAGLAAAIWGSRLGHSVRDRVSGRTLQILRFVLAAIAGALVAGAIGGAVKWLYELDRFNNLMATSAGGILMALAGGGVALAIGRRWLGEVSGAAPLRFLLGVFGIGGGLFLGIGAGYVADLLLEPLDAAGTMWAPGLVGATLGIVAVFASRKVDSLPSGMATYYMSRTLFNGIRSVEPLIMAIVFVVWVGIGPFAGALALALHTTAALAKLYSEQVESILPGPIEAVTATGATKLQNVVYAVVPQIVPPYIAFTLYRWDINVRMSTIIGFAGGGGIGFLLQQNINLLQYRAASVQMLAIAIVVSTLDFVSARIRERIV